MYVDSSSKISKPRCVFNLTCLKLEYDKPLRDMQPWL